MNDSFEPSRDRRLLISRRDFLGKTVVATAGLLTWRGLVHAGEANVNQRYKIGVCDWMILKRQKLARFNSQRKSAQMVWKWIWAAWASAKLSRTNWLMIQCASSFSL